MSIENNQLSHANLYNDCKKNTGIYGWFQALVGNAIAVVNDEKKTIYYHKVDLVRKLCLASHVTLEKKDIKRLSHLMIEVLHPVKGMHILASKVETLFLEIKSQEDKPLKAEDLIAKLSHLKNKHLTVLSYRKAVLLENMKPGDILFKLNPDSSDNMVVRAQKFSQHFLRTKHSEREGYKHSHVAMYLGDGQIAEAVPSHEGGVQLRSLDLEDSRFALSDDYNYVVSRSENEELAHDAVNVAKSVVKNAKPVKDRQINSNQHKYAFINAARSVYHSASFGIFAKQRYLKQYIDHKRGTEPLDFMAPKEFFCSNFVAYCYQTAESLKIAPKIIGENNEPPRAFTGFGAAMFRGIWARVQRWKYLSEWNRQVQMKFDAKWMTPHDFRNFIVGNPNLFKDKLFFKAEKLETIIAEVK